MPSTVRLPTGGTGGWPGQVRSNGPPTFPPFARNSAMTWVLKSFMSDIGCSFGPPGRDRRSRPRIGRPGGRGDGHGGHASSAVPGILGTERRHGPRHRRLLLRGPLRRRGRPLPDVRAVRLAHPAPLVRVGLSRGGTPLRLAPGGGLRSPGRPTHGPVRRVRRRGGHRTAHGAVRLVTPAVTALQSMRTTCGSVSYTHLRAHE